MHTHTDTHWLHYLDVHNRSYYVCSTHVCMCVRRSTYLFKLFWVLFLMCVTAFVRIGAFHMAETGSHAYTVPFLCVRSICVAILLFVARLLLGFLFTVVVVVIVIVFVVTLIHLQMAFLYYAYELLFCHKSHFFFAVIVALCFIFSFHQYRRLQWIKRENK